MTQRTFILMKIYDIKHDIVRYKEFTIKNYKFACVKWTFTVCTIWFMYEAFHTE